MKNFLIIGGVAFGVYMLLNSKNAMAALSGGGRKIIGTDGKSYTLTYQDDSKITDELGRTWT